MSIYIHAKKKHWHCLVLGDINHSFTFIGVPVVSLESAERPNYFLAVSGRSRLQMEQWSREVEFSRRATFIQHQGLFLPGYTSFELVSQPGTFLTLTRSAARAQRYDSSEGFKASSSFVLEGQNYNHTSSTRIMVQQNMFDSFRKCQQTFIRFLSLVCLYSCSGQRVTHLCVNPLFLYSMSQYLSHTC